MNISYLDEIGRAERPSGQTFGGADRHPESLVYIRHWRKVEKYYVTKIYPINRTVIYPWVWECNVYPKYAMYISKVCNVYLKYAMCIQGLISSEWWQLGESRAFYTRMGFWHYSLQNPTRRAVAIDTLVRSSSPYRESLITTLRWRTQ